MYVLLVVYWSTFPMSNAPPNPLRTKKFSRRNISNLLLSLRASLRAFLFRSAVKLASSILRGDQEAKRRPSKTAARKATKATEARPAMKGNESFFTARPVQRPKAPPNTSSLNASLDIFSQFDEFFFLNLFVWHKAHRDTSARVLREVTDI